MSTASCPGWPVGCGWMWAKVPRSSRVAMRCIQASWLRVRSSTGLPVAVSTTVATSRVGWPGRTSAGRSRRTSSPASAASVAGTSAVIITLIAGRIGMPVPCAQASWPFMPCSAKSIRDTAVSPAPSDEGDDGDAGQVGVLADPGAQRRVQDLARRWPGGGSGAAAARW